ncbi:TPA: beta family protein [Acinetobacter baumannii]|nr:beta family protein [Acinetobacter baumannii]
MNLESTKYIPLLYLKPAEMVALQELPEKEKEILLPIIVLRRWLASKSFETSLVKIREAFGNRPTILDLDFFNLNDLKIKDGEKHLEFLNDFEPLFDSQNGYINWVQFIQKHENFIPVLQLQDLDELATQIDNFSKLNRLMVLKLKKNDLETRNLEIILEKTHGKVFFHGLLIQVDYEDIDRQQLIEHEKIIKIFEDLSAIFPQAYFSFSATSFPFSFTNSYRGELPIYERQIFNKIFAALDHKRLIYSDRGSARASSRVSAGTPPPRIDYPLKNEWRFVRKEFKDGLKKEYLYAEAASEIMKSDYWMPELHLWGTQMIEKTSMSDEYGIYNPTRATAVRINIHLYQQLHYLENLSDLGTDEPWID